MKHILMLVLAVLAGTLAVHADEYDPVAAPEALVTSGNMRFTVLTPEMIRMEWSDDASFEDRASFAVVNRKLNIPSYDTSTENGYLYIRTAALTLRYKTGTYPVTVPATSDHLRITFNMDGREVVWYPGKTDEHNLKGTLRTLDNVAGWDGKRMLEDGIISRSGWALIDEGKERGDGSLSLLFNDSETVPWVASRKDGNSIDWYFMGYGRNYKKALNDFIKVAGKINMPPMYIFGYWYSKYQCYTEQDFKDIVAEISQNDIPLDVMVVDMDWHLEGWTGWTWNKELFPDPARFIQSLHDSNLKVTLNLHPADGIGTHEENHNALASALGLPLNEEVPWNLADKDFYQAFFQHILRPHENIGVDFWWVDWQQELISEGVNGLSNTFWINHVFYNDMEKMHPDRRPVIFHRWGGLGNHRYPIGFSGDTYTDYESLSFQPYFTATASNVGYGYWSHDIGGHQQFTENNPELYLRWIQYGIFSPVVRSHSANFSHIERRIWKYPNFNLMNEAIKLRYQLVPYIYTYARYAYDTGISLCRPMYYDYPEHNEAYNYNTQYMFGDDILVAPIVEPAAKNGISTRTLWLPEGKWYEVASGKIVEGGRVYVSNFALSEIPYYYKEGAVIPLFPSLMHLKERPDKLVIQFAPGNAGKFTYYEDENDNNNYKAGKYTTTLIEQKTEGNTSVYTIHPREGQFDNMPSARGYELQLLAKGEPVEVEVNGQVYSRGNDDSQTGVWTYDEARSCVTIYIPETACTSKTEVTVLFNQHSGINSTDAGNEACIGYSHKNQEIEISFKKMAEQVRIELFSLEGIKIFSTDYQNVQFVNKSIAADQLPGSVYVCRVYYDNKVAVQKIIK